MTKKLEETLNLTPYSNDEAVVAEVINNENIADVIQTAKDNVENARDIASQAVADVLELAQRTQDPKIYEVLNGLLKTYSDISSGTIDILLKKQRFDRNEASDPSAPTKVEQHLHVSTADLLKMIQEHKNG